MLIVGAVDLATVTEKSRRRPRYRHHTKIVAREKDSFAYGAHGMKIQVSKKAEFEDCKATET